MPLPELAALFPGCAAPSVPGPVTGMVLIPGLNMRPEALLPLARYFERRELRVTIPLLPDAGGVRSTMTAWCGAVAAAWHEAGAPGGRTVLAGFSLGAVLALLLRLRLGPGEQPPLLLLAPPFCLRPGAGLLAGLSRIPLLSFPSLAPARFRQRSWTTGRAYRALFLLRRLLLRHAAALGSVAGTAVFHTRDELVHPDRSAVRLAGLSSVTVQTIDASRRGWRSHLFVVPESPAWSSLLECLEHFSVSGVYSRE